MFAQFVKDNLNETFKKSANAVDELKMGTQVRIAKRMVLHILNLYAMHKQQELMSDLINSNVERMPLKNITNNNSRIVSTSSCSSSKINSDSVFNGENISNPVFNKYIQQHTSFPSEAP